MCTDEINDKIKMNLAPIPSATVTVFLIAEKLLNDFEICRHSVCLYLLFCEN